MIEIEAVRQSPSSGNAVLNSSDIQSGFSPELIREDVIRTGILLDLLHRFVKVLVRPIPLLALNVHACRFKHILAYNVRVAACSVLPHAWKDIILAVFF
ncbi:hypothetical protein D3C77_473660 [compost metagenome]